MSDHLTGVSKSIGAPWYLFAYLLHAITTSSQGLTDITTLLHFPFVMFFLCYYHSSFCLFWEDSPFLSPLCKVKSSSVGLRALSDLLGQSEIFHFFILFKSFAVFWVMVLLHDYIDWMHLSVNWQTECYCILLNLPLIYINIKISKLFSEAAIQAQAVTLPPAWPINW